MVNVWSDDLSRVPAAMPPLIPPAGVMRRPVDTTSPTALPAGTNVPAAGVSLMTRQAGIVELAEVVTAPTTRPAPVIAVVAAACVRRSTFETATDEDDEPVETTSATALQTTTDVPAVGDSLITDPLGTVVLDAEVIMPTTSPTLVIVVVAAVCVWLTTSGTGTCGGPLETTRSTALPTTTEVPAAGDSLITDPLGTVVLVALVIAPTTSPAPVIAAVAAVCV